MQVQHRRRLTLALILYPLSFLLLPACSTAPTRFDQKFYDIQTNQVPRVVLVTNTIAVPATPLADANTNHATAITWQTNIVAITNFLETYTYAPNTNAAQLVSTVSRTTSLLGPWGELAGIVLGGMLGAYGLIRSSRAAKTAGVLAQIIETGRQVLQSTPQGQALDQQWKLWMMQHQAEQGVVLDVIKLLDNVVDEPSAKLTAQELISLMKKQSS